MNIEIVTLCHKYGMRGRAMAYSIASRQPSDIQISMHVYAARQQDIDMIHEGNAAGQNPIRIRHTMVPEKDVLKRSVYFNGHVNKTPYVAYADVDLWFPVDFWDRFAADIKSRDEGYWSVSTLDADIDLVEAVVRDYRIAIADNGFVDPYSVYKGKVGRFQCMPKDFEPYCPVPDYRDAVDGSDLDFADRAIAKSADKREDRRIGIPAFHLTHPTGNWQGTSDEL